MMHPDAETSQDVTSEQKSPMAEICEEMKLYADGNKAAPANKVKEWASKLEDLSGYMDSEGQDECPQDAQPDKKGGLAIIIQHAKGKMKAIVPALILLGLCQAARADNTLTFSSNTASASTGTVVNVSTSSRADRLDFIHVNTPGTSSKIDVWDWKGSTLTAARKIGSYDTTAKFNWTFGPFGLDISTDVLIYNQGNPAADVTIGGRRSSGKFP